MTIVSSSSSSADTSASELKSKVKDEKTQRESSTPEPEPSSKKSRVSESLLTGSGSFNAFPLAAARPYTVDGYHSMLMSGLFPLPMTTASFPHLPHSMTTISAAAYPFGWNFSRLANVPHQKH